MAIFSFNNVGISGISAVVPKRIIKNDTFSNVFSDEERRQVIALTGVEERRFAEKNICSSDLCLEAANVLIENIGINPMDIDMVIFLSLTPDYHQPPTAPILQNKLNLKKGTGAFDISMACAGYIYALSTAYAYASLEHIKKVLLLTGETSSKVISYQDKATSLLFGDAAAATLVEKGEFGKSFFSLNSDGSGEDMIKVKSGGYRYMSSPESTTPKKFDNGSTRSDENVFMDGAEVFNFSMREIPRDIIQILDYAGMGIEQIDYLVFHQANRFITDRLAKKVKCPSEKLPYSIQKYGNTGSVSIPLTISSELRNALSSQKKKILMSGFGAGLSWASAILTMGNCFISEVIESTSKG